MATDAVAAVKARLDIVEVIGAYVRLQRSGRAYKALCPFHSERTPSFTVSEEKQAWFCFGCQEGGDLFSFVEKIERVDFVQALELLADRAGVELDRRAGRGGRRTTGEKRARILELNRRAQAYFEHVLWATEAGQPGRALLQDRGVGDTLAREFGLGFAPAGGSSGDALVRYLVARASATPEEVAAAGLAHPSDRGVGRDRFRHRLVFPIRDERGSTVAFGARALGDAIPKYLNSPATAVYDKSTALFGIDLAREAIGAARSAVLVEGYFDVITAHAAGIRNVVASSGTALTREQVRVLHRHAPSIVLCFDGDEAGRAATNRAVEVIAAEGLDARIVVLPPGAKDPDELGRSDPTALSACVTAAEAEWKVLLDRAVGDARGGTTDERRAAAERAIALLARIPVAATRELYVQQAARHLELHAESLASDVERVRRDPRRSTPRVVAAMPRQPAAPAGDARLPAAGDGNPPPAWESHLAALLVHRPSVAAPLAAEQGLSLDELTHPGVRAICSLATGVPDGAAFPLQSLEDPDRRLAARLLMRTPPELEDPDDESPVRQAVSDDVRSLRLARKDGAITETARALHEAHESGDAAAVDRLAARLTGLCAERDQLRSPASSAL